MSVVSMKQLLEAGVHFGHQTRRWNPKMKKYIFDSRNGIYIIDLQKTLKLLEEAYHFIVGVASEGGDILFVGTKKQAQDTVQEEARRCGMHFINQRWLGGALTNFKTISTQLQKMKELGLLKEAGYQGMTKKEALLLEKKRAKLEKYLSGIHSMEKLPAAVFVIDPKKERIAVAEANRLRIPVVGIVDTNCDPDDVTFVIPSNDDAIRAIKLITGKIADAVAEGRRLYQEKRSAEMEAKAAEAEAAEKARAEMSAIKVTVEDMAEGEAAEGKAEGGEAAKKAPAKKAAARKAAPARSAKGAEAAKPGRTSNAKGAPAKPSHRPKPSVKKAGETANK